MTPRALDPIFSPRSIAVVGASRRRDSIGFALLHNLLVNEFNCAIYPVNPHAESVHSLKCYPSLAAIPDPVDLAMILVPSSSCRGRSRSAWPRG
jgi:acyl-CoA synthetase (NDP forming)